MAYLTYAEYTSITLSETPVEEDAFNRLLRAATLNINIATNYFYARTDLDSDFTARRDSFKTALVYLIDYYDYLGRADSFAGYQGNATTVTIGRTTQTQGSNANINASHQGFPQETIDLLNLWGLLYRGVGTTGC